MPISASSRSRTFTVLQFFALSIASPAPASPQFSIHPDTIRTRNLAAPTTFRVITDTLAPGATLQIDLPWTLIGFDPASPPPPLGPDQLDIFARGAPLLAPPRIDSHAAERAIRIRIVHPGPALSHGDTLDIVPRFVLTPSLPGTQTVDFVLTPVPGAPSRVLSAPIHVLPSITLAALTSIEPGAPLPIRARADAAVSGVHRVIVELDSRRVRLEGPDPLLGGHITAPERPGFYRIRASDPDRLAPPVTAVVHVTSDPAAHRIWWADLHGHSELSDGFGTPEQFYRYARHHSLLDAASLTDHDHLLDDAEWTRVCALADSMERLPNFSAIPAYEWSSRFGDRNVYLPAHHAPIPRRGDPWSDHVRELQAWARETGAILIPHHPASGFRSVDWTLHSPDIEPVCEVYSIHGWAWTDTTTNPLTPRTPTAQRSATPRLAMAVPGRAYDSARALDPALGVIASGDIHTAQPGNLGLAAIRAPTLDRRSLLDALRHRRVYGTTGARILLELSADGPGLTPSAGAPTGERAVHLHALAAAPGELASLTLLKNGAPWIRRERPGFPARIDAVDAPATTTSYQLLAIQTDGERAFSSPIVAHPAAAPRPTTPPPPAPATPIAQSTGDLDFHLDAPATIRLDLRARCDFRGVPGPGPELIADALYATLDGIPLSAPGLDPPALSGDRLDGLHLDGDRGHAWWIGGVPRGPHTLRLRRQIAPSLVEVNASRLLDQVPPARLPISRSRFLLGPDRPPTLLYTLEDAFSLTRHPIAPDAGLLLITWSRDLSRTSAFGEESRWVEIELGLQGGQYALRPHRFEPGRDFAADDGHGGVRVTARADRPAALEILYRGDQVDAIVTLRRGGRWDEGFWRLAGKEHEAPLDGDGLRIPLAGRPRSIDLIRFGDPAAFPAAEPALDAPIVRGFPDTSVFAAIVDRFPESPEIETAIERAARGRDAAFLRRVAHLHTGPAADAWRERAALAPGAGAADWRAALRARRLAGDAEGALTLFSKAPERFGPELDEERGRLLRALGRWSEAAEAFSSARVRGDTSLDLLIAEAECRRKSKEADTARFLLDQALKRDAQHSRALREWVRLNEESAPNEALRALEQLSVTEPNDPWVALRLALTLHALGDDEAARRALERFFEFEAPEAMTARARRLAEKLVRSPG